MAIHINNDEAEFQLRDFARRHNLSITNAIIEAVLKADRASRSSGEELRIRIEPIVKVIRERRAVLGNPPYTSGDDKAFMDEMWGELPDDAR